LALIVAPTDQAQGHAQRIVYFHVPLVWVSFIAFISAAVYSLKYLRLRNSFDDVKAESLNLIGWLFTSTVLITGPLWAKPIWGIFWDWSDERLVSFFVMWMMYNVYFMLRLSITDREKAARISAVLSFLALANAGLVFAAIFIWKTNSHPSSLFIKNKSGGFKNTMMKWAFWGNILSFLLLFFTLTWVTVRYKSKKAEVENYA